MGTVQERLQLIVEILTSGFKGATQQLQRMTTAVKPINKELQRFNFNMLGVLFFGMAVTRVFLGLLQPAFDLLDTFGLLNLFLGLGFLPTSLKVNKKVMELGDSFLSVDEGTREWVGDIALAIAGIGGLLTGIAVLILGVESLRGAMLASPTIAFLVRAIVGAFSFLTGPIGLIITAIVLLIIGFKRAWDKNFLGIQDNFQRFKDALKQIWEGIKKVVSGAMEFITGIIEGDTDKIFEALDKIAEGFKDILEGGINAAIESIGLLLKGLLGSVVGAVNTILEKINLIPGVNIPLIPGEGFSRPGTNLSEAPQFTGPDPFGVNQSIDIRVSSADENLNLSVTQSSGQVQTSG